MNENGIPSVINVTRFVPCDRADQRPLDRRYEKHSCLKAVWAILACL